ncbi:uncharacterized protein JCM15063_002320 [Sporobolomyces koalae]|uniref:uncharacterized protein n=1 Tax=Sporobolomyces koalae TaxID=500713 RepID=UPI00317D47D6
MDPLGYSHYQPPPQPLRFPLTSANQPNPYAVQLNQHLIPAAYPVQLEQLQQRGATLSSSRFGSDGGSEIMTNFAPPAIGNPFAQLDAFNSSAMPNKHRAPGLGQDFELFGPSDPLGGIGADIAPAIVDDDSTHSRMHAPRPSFDASMPDLVPDQGSPSVDSPPSPAFAPTARLVPSPGSAPSVPPSRPPLPSQSSNGSYRGEGRACSVPPPEFPRPIRRKTQESHHWPSFVSNGGSSSSTSSSSSSTYLPTPQQAPLPFADEPITYALPPSAANSFDPASLSLSPAQYPYAYQAPHTDHPLLPSEQSDLLDRVRRDLLDVDLASIKGPLRALALSGGSATPAQFSMASPLPPFARYSQPCEVADRDKTPTPRANQYAASFKSPRSPAVSALQTPHAASSIGTVSPQEAFLDYPVVDSKLHDLDPKDGKLARSDFGVGVGHSLFAPLPAPASSLTHNPNKVKVKKVSNAAKTMPAPTLLQAFPSVTSAAATPRSATPQQSGTSTSRPNSSQSSTTPAQQRQSRHHGPHPFSVPQNAVSWATRRSNSGRHLVGGIVDGDADDDDGDFGEPSSSAEVTAGEEDAEEEERKLQAIRDKVGLPDGFGRFRKQDLSLDRDTTKVERDLYDLDRHGESNGTRPVKEEYDGHEYKVPLNLQQPVSWAAQEDDDDAVPPPPPRLDSHQQTFSSPPQPALPASLTGSFSTASGTSTPRRAAAVQALADLQASPPRSLSSLTDSNPHTVEFAEPPTSRLLFAAPAAAPDPNRSQRQRKRSRLALEDEQDTTFSDQDAAGVSSDEYRDDEDSVAARKADESDESYHSSSNAPTPASANAGAASSRRNANASGPVPKRRRRGQPSASSTTTSGTTSRGGNAPVKGSIACDHVGSDGRPCGVIFRRPYDLARHKETIHGVTMGGEKLPPGKAKEWKCKECGGTFSRKDALLRHGRIRGHKPGV